MQGSRGRWLLAVFCSVALHGLVLALAGGHRGGWPGKPDVFKPDEHPLVLELAPRPPRQPTPKTARQTPASSPGPAPVVALRERREDAAKATPAERQPATQPAPPAPTAEEWAFAGKYTLKNSKGYRYSWGQQVRSMMGTAIAGQHAGEVRFRVEIAPDGTLATLETLWTTSALAEQLARKAIERMPPLPSTPTGKPLVFERTISFSPFASDWPPVYDDDCLPDPAAFKNPYAWDGKSPQTARVEPGPAEKLDPKALEECLRQLPRNSIDAEIARERRIMDRWGSDRLGR